MAWNRKTSLEDMDKARDEAAEALARMPQDTVRLMANWWHQWYMKAGHKRLGRLLLTKKQVPSKSRRKRTGRDNLSGDSSGDLRARITDLGSRYVLEEAHLDSSAFFVIDEVGAEIRIVLNSNHPAHKTIVSALRHNLNQRNGQADGPNEERDILLQLLIGWAEVERQQPHGSRRNNTQSAREDWGRAVRDLFNSPHGSK